MRKWRWKRVLAVLAALGLLIVLFLFTVAPIVFDCAANRSTLKKPYAISPEAARLHSTLVVADLHSDTLMWNRDPLERHNRGHVDIPRMVEGNVALQAFTIVTRVPASAAGIGGILSDYDAVGPLFILERWPVSTWSSLMERALYQTRRLHDVEARSHGTFRIILSAKQLDAYLQERQNNPELAAGFMGVEGLHCLEGKLENLDRLYDAGVRMAGFSHFFDNEVGGSAHGHQRGGITAFGEDALRRAEEKHMVLDLAHASPKLIDDVLDRVARPLLVSHTGLKGTCDTERNISDEHARRIAEKGGVIGIGYFPWAVCGKDVAAIVRAIRYGVALVGADHIALGSDYDGTVVTPFDTSGVGLITDALLREGVSPEDIGKIMGGNVVRLLKQVLPQE